VDDHVAAGGKMAVQHLQNGRDGDWVGHAAVRNGNRDELELGGVAGCRLVGEAKLEQLRVGQGADQHVGAGPPQGAELVGEPFAAAGPCHSGKLPRAMAGDREQGWLHGWVVVGCRC
jgi:hypothetical protein